MHTETNHTRDMNITRTNDLINTIEIVSDFRCLSIKHTNGTLTEIKYTATLHDHYNQYFVLEGEPARALIKILTEYLNTNDK